MHFSLWQKFYRKQSNTENSKCEWDLMLMVDISINEIHSILFLSNQQKTNNK